MNEKIKAAVIGLGEWGPKLARNLNSIDDFELKALVDSNQFQLDKIKKIYPSINTFPSIDELLNNEVLDAVLIATPAGLHYEHVKKCLGKNLNIFVEKPLALSVRDASECFNIAGEKKLILMAGHTFVYNPAVRCIKKFIDKGSLGKIYYVSSQRLSLGRIRDDVNVLWNLAPHDFSILLYLLEEMPITVSAHGARLLKTGQEDVVVITFEYADFRCATVELCWLNPQKVRKMTFIAEKCMLVYDDVSEDKKITIYDKTVKVTEHFEDPEGSFKRFKTQITSGEMTIPEIIFDEPLGIELRHFAQCIKTKSEPITGKSHTLKITYLLEKADESLKRGGEKIALSF